MKIKRILIAVLFCTSVMAITGCGGSSGKNTDTETSASKKDKEVVENEESHVVVATSVAVVEILDRLGVKVDGVPTTSYDLPENTQGATEIGNPMSPDVEIIKSLEPTIVVSTDTLGTDYESLFQTNNIPSLFVDLDSLEGLKLTVQQLAERFNKEEAGEQILKELQDKEDSFKELSMEKEKDIMIVFAAPGGVSMLATEDSYIGNLVKIAGGNNLVEETGVPFVAYNSEALSQMNPSMILVMTHAMPEKTMAEFKQVIATDAAWQNIEAVKEGKIEFLDSNYFGMSANLKVIDSLELLHSIMYPEDGYK